MNNQWLLAVLEEYKTLRAESLESLKGQQTTLRTGTATIGILVAIGFNVWERPNLAELVFFLFIPFICYLSLIIWIGEVSRMMRAGKFISGIEKKINAYFSDEPDAMSWENWLRTKAKNGKKPQMLSNYFGIIFLFLATALCSIFTAYFSFDNQINYFKISKNWILIGEGILWLIVTTSLLIIRLKFKKQ